jgi:hypothetical protein
MVHSRGWGEDANGGLVTCIGTGMSIGVGVRMGIRMGIGTGAVVWALRQSPQMQRNICLC